MDLLIERLTHDADSSISAYFRDRVFECFLCEDEPRDVKVKGETRLRPGAYLVTLRAEGGMHQQYTERFGADWHKGMLWIHAPDFEFAYLHIGNYQSQTDGCPLTGLSVMLNDEGGGSVGGSTRAYRKIYPPVRDALLRGESVVLFVVDRDRPV